MHMHWQLPWYCEVLRFIYSAGPGTCGIVAFSSQCDLTNSMVMCVAQ